MRRANLKVCVPGKLMIAGEYAVLEPHQRAVVTAVNRYVTATISEDTENVLVLPGLGLARVGWREQDSSIEFDIADTRLRFFASALRAALGYLREQGISPRTFSLSIDSELDDASGRKYGLGSSAAVVVAVVSAVLYMFAESAADLTKDLIFKLAAIAHFEAQGSGSGTDVAASTFGGWLLYSSFQSEWLSERLARKVSLEKLLQEDWPFFSVRPLVPPRGLTLCVGWTGSPAATAPLIQKVRGLLHRDSGKYGEFLRASEAAVKALVQSFEDEDASHAIAALAKNREALLKLGQDADVCIETKALRELHTCAVRRKGAGKPSGAGGGDCGVAFVKDVDAVPQLFTDWRRSGIEPLMLEVSETGVAVVAPCS